MFGERVPDAGSSHGEGSVSPGPVLGPEWGGGVGAGGWHRRSGGCDKEWYRSDEGFGANDEHVRFVTAELEEIRVTHFHFIVMKEIHRSGIISGLSRPVFAHALHDILQH